METTSRNLSLHLALVLVLLNSRGVFAADGPRGTARHGTNIALGKPYTFSQPTNYRKCGGPSDRTDLTDGTYTDGEAGAFWVTGTTAGWGWLHTRHVWIMIDLGRVEPIQGVSYSTAGGWGGVSWPLMIDIQVSDDGKAFHSAGDLVDLTRGDIPDPAARWTVRRSRYETMALRTRGRYVRLVIVPSSRFVFCDEIEVSRGPDSFLTLSPGANAEERIAPERMVQLGCKHRLRVDLQRVRGELNAAPLTAAEKAPALDEADRIAKRIAAGDYSLNPGTFRAVVPCNDLHREIFRLRAHALASEGVSALRVWQNEIYAPLSPFDRPTGAGAELHVRMMRNEFRSAAFNLTNESPNPETLELRIQGLPGGTNPLCVMPHKTEFVDTRDGVVVASALVPLPREGEPYLVEVPAGMTRQVWLLFRPGDLAAGDYGGEVLLTGTGVTRNIPLRLSLAAIRFPDDIDLFFSMWDYALEADPHIARELTPLNRDAAVRDLREHFVNVPVSMKMPWPRPGAFDAEGNLVGEIDYSEFDGWVRAWPGAKCYAVFARVWPGPSSKLGGIHPGQKPFPRALSQWAATWADHNRVLGLEAGQVAVLFVDEPHTEEQYQQTLEWAEPFRAGTRDIRVLTTATLAVERNPRQIEALRACDTIWTKRWSFTNNDDEYWSTYRGFQMAGSDVWFYMCEGPVLQFDPAYYRLQPWYCLQAGVTGSAFWSYCDGGGGDSWCPYASWRKKNSFTPVYIGRKGVTTSKHWEAAREGVEDHQYMLMLRRKVMEFKQRGLSTSAVREAAALVDSLPGEAIGRLDKRDILIAHKEWGDTAPSRVAEDARLRALTMLMALEGLHQ